jgi:hypothetical protein
LESFVEAASQQRVESPRSTPRRVRDKSQVQSPESTPSSNSRRVRDTPRLHRYENAGLSQAVERQLVQDIIDCEGDFTSVWRNKEREALYGKPNSKERKSVYNKKGKLVKIKQNNPEDFWKVACSLGCSLGDLKEQKRANEDKSPPNVNMNYKNAEDHDQGRGQLKYGKFRFGCILVNIAGSTHWTPFYFRRALSSRLRL